jgi:hypothetical protein
MIRTSVFTLLALSLCASADAASVDFTATGVFSSTDSPGDPLVVPGDTFSLSFLVPYAPTLSPSEVTPLSFDVPVSSFTYTLDGVPSTATLPAGDIPTDAVFYTSADGGGFELNFPDGFFTFGTGSDDQMFSGPTSAPTLPNGTYSNLSWVVFDGSNVDGGTAQVTATPEPSSLPILLCAGLAALAFGGRRFTQAR